LNSTEIHLFRSDFDEIVVVFAVGCVGVFDAVFGRFVFVEGFELHQVDGLAAVGQEALQRIFCISRLVGQDSGTVELTANPRRMNTLAI